MAFKLITSTAAVLTILVISTSSASAVGVNVVLEGFVSHASSEFFEIGDPFLLSFTYQVTTQGECPAGADFSSSIIYRCLGAVSSASATVGSSVFEFPPTPSFPPPIGSRESLLQVEDYNRDQFQGSINFQDTAEIAFPIIAFYLRDSSASYFDSPPRLPTSWINGSNGDIAQFDSPRATIFSYASGAQSLVTVTLTAVPVPSVVWLFGSCLFGLIGLARRKSDA